jgi:hypothetical protein
MRSQSEDVAVVDRVKSLINLGAGEADGNQEEARNAAVQACKLILQQRLALLPESNLEDVRKGIEGMRQELQQQKSSGTKNILIGAGIGLALAKLKLF